MVEAHSAAPSSRGERTRAQLLALAVRRFGERGFRETSLSAIAREVGISPAAVYAHFRDKDDLFAAALDHDATTWLDDAMQAPGTVPAGGSLPQLGPVAQAAVGSAPSILTWVGFLQRAHACLADHPLARRVLAGREPEMLARMFDLPASHRLRTLIADSLRQGQAIGMVRADIDPPLLAEGIASLVEASLVATVQMSAAELLTDDRRRSGVMSLLAAALLPQGAPQPRASTP